MISLKYGVLLKLLEDMKMEGNELEDDLKPVLLQIRSIIPVLEEGDLWPNRGFYLKVSDSSHALYVSLSEEQNELILGNKLQLGQFIHVQKLKNAHPVPLLKGVTLIPGRRACEGAPEDIVSPAHLVKFLEASPFNADSVVEKGVIFEKKVSKSQSISRKVTRGLSDSESSSKKTEGLKEGRRRSLSVSKARPGERTTKKCSFRRRDFEKTSYDDVCNDSDADSVVSSVSSMRISKRRSWNESEILGVKEIFDSSVVKHGIKFPSRSLSANVSPVRSVRYDSSEENSSLIARRRGAGSTKRLIERPNKSQAPTTKVDNVQISDSLCNLVYDRKGTETGISWNSLPSNLVKCGKEVIRQRDKALLAAADALQEACASERLLNSLSTLSQFPVSAGDHDLQPFVDNFFDLQRDLARTRLIMQSLTNISPLRTQETESAACTSNNSIKETLSIARQRKKNADAWIKSAIALDLSPCTPPLTNPPNSTNILKKTIPSDPTHKPKGACIIKRDMRSSTYNNSHLLLALDKQLEDQPDQWTRGSTPLCAAAELATSMQDECKKLFLGYVEKYLDEVDRKSSLAEYDGEMAEMMHKVKMVSDCLNGIFIGKEGERVGCAYLLQESDAEAYERVRNKIYGILLKHVERTAMAFERLNASITI